MNPVASIDDVVSVGTDGDEREQSRFVGFACQERLFTAGNVNVDGRAGNRCAGLIDNHAAQAAGDLAMKK